MKVKKLTESEWQKIVDECNTATFFHTPNWYKVWKEYNDRNYEARLLSFESGNEVVIPFSFRKRLKGFAKEHISSPVGTYGGPFSNFQLTDQEVSKVEKYISQFNSVQIQTNPLNPILKSSFSSKKGFTQIIDLKKSWEQIFKNWTKGHGSAAKKGIREGVKVRIANGNEWEKYYHLYQDSIRRWGKSASNNYKLDLFLILKKLDPAVCKLWVAIAEDKIISGCLCFYHNQHVVYWHGASLESHFHLKPVHVLQHHIIKNAKEAGYFWYDFNPSGGHEGVVKFKNGFGTDKMKTNTYVSKSTLFKIILR